jgi:glycosyltransferase involved in cell wall biosynthesis
MNISVALCTHNGAAFIETQLRSIFEQTLPPRNIIVSDDASSDRTVEIVRTVAAEYFAKSHPTSVMVLENTAPLGTVANFEKAVSATTGDFIALCDQDDVWSEAKLETLIGLFRDDELLSLVHSNARLVDADGNSLGITLFEALAISQALVKLELEGGGFPLLMRRNTVTGATVLFRRSILDVALPFPNDWVHDEWLAVIAAAVGKISVCDTALIDYRQHEKNQIGATMLTLKGRLAKLRRPRVERNRRLLVRSQALANRLDQLGELVDAEKVIMAKQKVQHERQRSSLPKKRLARIIPIIREARTGRYRRMGSGANDILRDLVQPSS